MKKKLFNDKTLILLAFVFLIFMMLLNLTHSSPWGDEWAEYVYSQEGIRSGALYKRIMLNFQPPLYNILMHFWLKPSRTVLWFRLFNIPCGLIAGIFVFLAVKEISSFKAAILTVFTMGATYRWIYCIQECSEYALMLMFLAIALYFFIKLDSEGSVIVELFFIMACVGAMYSQYGAFFVVAPLLCLHYGIRVLAKDRKRLFRTSALYVVAFIVFAVPLYWFFARIHIANNAIVENSRVVLSFDLIKDFPFVFGKMVAEFLNLRRLANFNSVLTWIGVITLILAVYLLFTKIASRIDKLLIVVLLVVYFMYYWLVAFHIYAMVHPDQSSGYYSRYGYFFMPTLFIILPVIYTRIIQSIKIGSVQKIAKAVIACGLLILLFYDYPTLLDNWHKAYDKEMAEIWVYHAGFDETTFLCGGHVRRGFNYYTNLYGYKGIGEVLESGDIDLNNLPESFWIWRVNWSDDAWQKTVDEANEQGYQVIVYADYGSSGQLAHCLKKTE